MKAALDVRLVHKTSLCAMRFTLFPALASTGRKAQSARVPVSFSLESSSVPGINGDRSCLKVKNYVYVSLHGYDSPFGMTNISVVCFVHRNWKPFLSQVGIRGVRLKICTAALAQQLTQRRTVPSPFGLHPLHSFPYAIGILLRHVLFKCQSYC